MYIPPIVTKQPTNPTTQWKIREAELRKRKRRWVPQAGECIVFVLLFNMLYVMP